MERATHPVLDLHQPVHRVDGAEIGTVMGLTFGSSYVALVRWAPSRPSRPWMTSSRYAFRANRETRLRAHPECPTRERACWWRGESMIDVRGALLPFPGSFAK